MTALVPLLFSAFFTGLAGSAHCIGMCGGISTTLGLHSKNPTHALVYHGGRLLSYTLLGVLLGIILPLFGIHPAMANWGIWLRRLTSLLIALIGLQQFLNYNFWWLIEKYGQRLWKPLSPVLRQFMPVKTTSDAFILGTLWGLLPCGLIYGALSVAITTANPLISAVIMFCFGLGTLPAMLGIMLASKQVGQWLYHPILRRILGMIIVALAAWSFPY